MTDDEADEHTGEQQEAEKGIKTRRWTARARCVDPFRGRRWRRPVLCRREGLRFLRIVRSGRLVRHRSMM